MSIFEGDIFSGPRRGMYGAGMGVLPEGYSRISELHRWRASHPGIPSLSQLQAKGATHYTNRAAPAGAQTFTFYDSNGGVRVGPITIQHRDAEAPVLPSKDDGESQPAHRDSDGLLPSPVAERVLSSEPKWLPWLLVGGGVLVAGGIVYMGTRRVRPNRRRRSTRRRRRRRTTR